MLQALAHVRQRLAADEAYERRRAEAERTVAELTVREREVLQGIAAGYANRQIAETLGLSVRTVESYRADMTEKVGTTAVADLVRLALLVNLPPLEGEESPPARQER
nr:LuxR C-terminal-related transcriptional regulator [Pelagerythrobacter marinus]